jgi:hypothetical protein
MRNRFILTEKKRLASKSIVLRHFPIATSDAKNINFPSTDALAEATFAKLG